MMAVAGAVAAAARPQAAAAIGGGIRRSAAASRLLPRQQQRQHGQRRPAAPPRAAAKTAERTGKQARGGGGGQQFVSVEADGSDAWRLDPLVDALKAGAVGIIPTDSNPAFVCDLGSRAAVEKLLEIRGSRGSQKMGILCRSLQDVDTYTSGWPASRTPGQPDLFKLVRRVLPGPYTFILPASKELPKAITAVDKGGRAKRRHEVGVRLPDDPVAQYILSQLDRPLLCSTAGTSGGGGEEDEDPMCPDAATLMDLYGRQGLDFVVDAGPRPAGGTTVIDCTGAEPVVVREGKGDASWLEA